LQTPLTDCDLINQEVGNAEIFRERNVSCNKVICEVLLGEFGSELGVEGAAVADEGAGLGDVADKTHLSGFELVGVLNPTGLIVCE
jgi:hypothetical protein